MYYTEYQNALEGQSPACIGIQYSQLVDSLPPGNDVPLPPNPELEQQAFGGGNHHHTAITYNTFPEKATSSGYNRVNRLNEVSPHFRVKPNANGAFSNEYSESIFINYVHIFITGFMQDARVIPNSCFYNTCIRLVKKFKLLMKIK